MMPVRFVPQPRAKTARAGVLLCLALLLTEAVVVPTTARQLPPEGFLVGVGTHFAQNAPDPEGSFLLASQAGIASIRDDIGWTWVERDPGRFVMPEAWDNYIDAALRSGVEPLLVLDYGNSLYDGGNKPRSDAAIAAFTRYAEFAARHFKGKVHRYEVWNEWDNGGGGTTPGSAEDYARLLKSVYPAVKAVDPGITILADSVVFARGSELGKLNDPGLLRFLDGISIHPYQKTPEESVTALQTIETALQRSDGGIAVPLYATEIGWSTQSNGVSLARAAAYAARLLLLARQLPFLRGVWWYDFRNDGQDPKAHEQNFGLVWPDLTPKPAYYALADVTAALAGATLIGRKATADDDDWILRFRGAAGQEFWAVWTIKAEQLARFHLGTLAETPKPLTQHEIGRHPVDRAWVQAGRGTSLLSVTAGEMPVLVQGDLADVSVVGVDHQEFPGDRP